MPTLIGKLEILNNLSEIASNGTQSTAQVNLFGYTVSLTGNLATTGGNSLTFNTTGPTTLTLPTSGTLLTTASAASTYLPINDPTTTGTLTSPTVAISGGTISGVAISSGTVSGASISSGTISGAAISGGTINNTPVGGTTPSSGKFTTIQATSTITPSTTAGIVGTTLADNAQAGSVGEFVSASVTLGSAVSLTNNTPANITSISLTAGDWQVTGNVGFTASVGATQQQGWVNTASATAPGAASGLGISILQLTTAGLLGSVTPVMASRVNVSTTTTVYLGAEATFASGTASAYGIIVARRVR